MAELQSLTISLQDSFSAGANAVAQAADKMAAAIDKAAQSSTTTDTAIRTRGQSLDSLTAKIDGNAAATSKLEAIDRRYQSAVQVLTAGLQAQGASASEIADKIARLGVVRDQDAAKAKAQGEAIEQRFAPAVRGGAMALRDMAMQAQDAFVQISSGQSVFTTLIQQGSQVSQQMMAAGQGFSSLKAAASIAFGAILSPMGLFVTALASVTAGIYEMTAAGNAQAGMLNSVQQSLRGTQDNYTAMGQTVVDVAKKVSQTSGLGLTEALDVAKALANNRYFSGTAADLERLTRDAADLGAQMGGTAADGAKVLAAAIKDPTKAASDLADQFTQLNGPLRQEIDLAQKAGDQNGAFLKVLGALEAATKSARDNGLSPIGKAWQDLGNAFSGGTSGWKPFMDWLAADAAATIRNFTGFINDLKSAWQGIKSLGNIELKLSGANTVNLSAALGGVDYSVQQTSASTAGGAAVGGSTAATLTSSATKEAFVTQWMDAAKTAGSALGVSPNVLLAQWGLETGWGKSAYNNNVGNIKAGSNYSGQTFTNPGDPGASYRSYSSTSEFAADFVRLMQTDRYSAARGTGSNATAYGQALQSAGYATDPNYASKITSTAASIAGSGVTSEMVSNAKSAADETAKLVESSRDYKNLQLDTQIQSISDRMVILSQTTGTDTDEFKAQKEQLEKLTAQRYADVDAATQAQRQAESSLRSSAGLTAAEQALSSAMESRRQVALQAGQAFTSTDEEQVRTNLLKAQSQEYERLTFKITEATANSTGMAAAYDKGNQAVITATAEQSAYNEALSLFPRNSAQLSTAFTQLTEYYKKSASAAQEAKVAQTNLSSRDNLSYIATETSTLGMNEAQRTKLLAVMKAEQEMHRQFGDTLPKEAQDYIDLAGKVSDATSAFQHQQSVASELSSFFDSTFSTISTSITSAFSTGSISAIKFGDIAKSIASSLISEFAKLALINPLKNWLFGSTNSTVTLSDVIGNLFGGSTSSVGTSSSGSGKSAFDTLFAGAGTTVTASGALASGGSAVGVGTVGTGATFLDNLFGTSLTGGSEGLIATIGDKIVTGVTDALGNTAAATEIAANAGGVIGEVGSVEGVSSIARLAAGVADAAGASSETAGVIASAAGKVADAIPYIGTAISIITDLATGNYRGAGLVASGAATGALVGTFVFPGLGTAAGTAIGAAVGGLVDALFPQHALNSYQGTNVQVQNGRIVAGTTVDQVQSSDATVAGINAYGDALATYMDKTGLILTNLDSTLGNVGTGIKGLTQVASVSDPAIFSKLQFANNPNDTSNFGVAKGALYDMRFQSSDELNTELLKIAGFADAVSAVGITLKSVGKDISNIQISSVSGGDASRTATVQDASGNAITYHNDLRTALNNELPRYTYADTAALDTTISEVNTWVNSTLPGLLTPIEKTSSTVTEAVANISKTYDDAISLSERYGLDNTAVLRTAEDQAIAIIRRTSILAIKQAQTSYTDRNLIATQGGQAASNQKTMDDLATSATNEIESFSKSWTDTFGDAVKQTADYQNAIKDLSDTLANEATAKAKALQQAFDDTFSSLRGTAESYQARYLRAVGQNEQADLIDADTKAASERQSFIESFTSFFGDAITQSETFQAQLAYVDAAHYEERLAIQKKYGDTSVAIDQNTASNLKTAQGQVTSLFSSLKDYAHSLQTGSNSPLSPTAQYALASSQFNAVQGAAAAGDYASANQLKTYADSLLSASKAMYGSGVGYADDFSRVLDAISGVAANPDMLTATAQRDIAREQTAAIVDSQTQLRTAVADLQTEMAATRRELQAQTRLIGLAA